MNKKFWVNLVLVGVVCLGVGFGGGMQYTKFSTPSMPGRLQNFSDQGGRFAGNVGQRGGNAQNANFAMGEIIGRGENTLTVKLPNGGSRILILSNSTQIGKMSSGTIEDLQVGAEINSNGTTNTDGSLTAQSIQIRSARVQQ